MEKNRIPEHLGDRLEDLVEGLPMLSLRDTNGEGDSMAPARDVIESMLQQLIDQDHSNSERYKELIRKIKPDQQQPPSSSLSHRDQHEHEPDTSKDDLSPANFEAQYRSLSDEEMECLRVFCMLPQGFAVNKTELFYLYLSLGSNLAGKALDINDHLLHNLAAKGFITRVTTNSTSNCFSNNHRIQGSFLSLAKHNTIPTCSSYDKSGIGFHFLYYDQRLALINTSNDKLNSKTMLNQIPEILDAQVVHLGRWRHSPPYHYNNSNNDDHTRKWDDYIVADMESLHKVLKQMRKLRFLNLRGTSGIVHFPDSVSNLSQLLYLDLSACNNLESLPQGIASLTNLAYLDLSECYLLGQIPKEITLLVNLKVLKGFIINSDPRVPQTSSSSNNNHRKWFWRKKAAGSSSPCPFSEVSRLEKLEKLTIRTRTMGFPTKEDLDTLCQLPYLQKLGITWVGNPDTAHVDGDLQEFPKMMNKLELQSAPHQTASRLLELISQKEDSCLNKLYIRGGGLRGLSPEKHCLSNLKILRLRYLPELFCEWGQFRKSFPDLTRLEVIECPSLIFFLCDENGIWEELE